MFELALRTSVVLGVAWIAALSLRGASAATRHLLWHAALIAVLAAPLLSPLAPKFEMPAISKASDVAARLTLPLPPLQETSLSPSRDAGTLGNTGTHGTSTVGTFGAGTLGTLWLAASLLVSAWFAFSWLTATQMARRARRAPQLWQMEVDGLLARMRIARRVRVRMVASGFSPLAVGLWRPTILLPETALAWDADRRRAVMLHELAHIRRGDCRVQALAHIACAVYRFNPLVWAAAAHLRSERERACDDEVLRSGARPSSYAAHLLDIARELGSTRQPTAALAMARPTELEGRLLSVLAAGRARIPLRSSRWVIVATLAIATGVALGATPVTVAAPGPEAAPLVSTSPQLFVEMTTTPGQRLEAQRTVMDASEILQSSHDPQARQRAATALAESGQADTIRPLYAALDDADPDVREKAALALAMNSSPDVIPALLKALANRDGQVREKAAIGLALRRDPRVVEALLVAINDRDSQVREKVAIALGTSGDPRAAAALEGALQDPDSQVREKAVSGLMLLQTGGGDPQRAERVGQGLRSLVGALLGLTK